MLLEESFTTVTFDALEGRRVGDFPGRIDPSASFCSFSNCLAAMSPRRASPCSARNISEFWISQMKFIIYNLYEARIVLCVICRMFPKPCMFFSFFLNEIHRSRYAGQQSETKSNRRSSVRMRINRSFTADQSRVLLLYRLI